jgi:hypothetical protein
MKCFKAGYESVQGHVGASPYRTAGSDDTTLGIHASCLLMMKRYLKEMTLLHNPINLSLSNLSFFITEAECLQRGTDWTFKSDRYSFVLKGLKGAGLMKTCLKYNL